MVARVVEARWHETGMAVVVVRLEEEERSGVGRVGQKGRTGRLAGWGGWVETEENFFLE
jgi:hypothetical protein